MALASSPSRGPEQSLGAVTSGTRSVRAGAGAAAVVLLLLLACLPAFQNGLVWDDIYVIEKGDVIFHAENLSKVFSRRTMFISSNNATLPMAGAQTYRPLTASTFFWDAWMSGRSPTSYHVTNFVAHAFATLLLLLLLRRMNTDAHPALAMFGALMFGVSPELAEAHVWINGRSDLFAGLFAIGAAVVFERALRHASATIRNLGIAAGSLLVLAALLSKESAFGLVFVLPWIPAAGATVRARVMTMAATTVAAVIYFVMRTHALDGVHASDGAPQMMTALLNAPILLADAASELLVPVRVSVRALSEDYASLGGAARLLITVSSTATLLVLAIAARRNERLRFGIAWFVVTLLPAAFVTTTMWPGFGRFLCLPAQGLGIVVVELVRMLIARLPQTETRALRLLAIGGILYVSLLAVRLHTYARVWHDEVTLYRQWIEAQPDRPHGYAWLGMTYLEHGNERDAYEYLTRAADRSPRDLRFRAMAEGIEARRDAARTNR